MMANHPPVILYLRQSDRALVAHAPPGSTLDPELTAGTFQLEVNGDQWLALDAAQQALPAGQDLIVNPDLSTSAIVHVPTLAEQQATARKGALKAFAHNPAPAAADRDAALRALIQHLGLDI